MSGSAPDMAYTNIRDRIQSQSTKAYVEELWMWFQPLADTHFRSDAKAHFYERFWEMYLAKGISETGHHLERGKNSGPDFLINMNGLRIWIEATAPGSGEGDDAVPELEFGVAQRVPEEEILLRLRSALSSKLSAWIDWRNQGVVEVQDSLIIAINGRRIRPAMPEPEPPYIVKAVFSIGSPVAVLDTKTGRLVDSFYDRRSKLNKRSGAEVRTDIFLTEKYQEVSAVIYSFADMGNKPAVEGDEFQLIHNPMARVQIPRGFLGRGIEYWIEDDELVTKDWKKSKEEIRV